VGATSVFADLRAMGFTVKAGMFSALETGASQYRRRLFIMAHADKIPLLQQHRGGVVGHWTEVQGRSDTDGQPGGTRQGGEDLDPDLAVAQSLRCGTEEEFSVPIFPPPPHRFAAWSAILGRRPDLQPELFGLDDGVADRMDRSDAAGNGVVSLAAAYAWRTLRHAHYVDCDRQGC